MKTLDFEFPVRIQKGSWEALIPETIAQWIKLGSGVAATAYVASATKKMAERDFQDFGIKDVFKKSLFAIQWVIKIGKHLGDLTIKQFKNLKFRDNNEMIGICNSEGEYLFIPKIYFDLYVATNPNLLQKITEIIEEDRILSISVYDEEIGRASCRERV